MANVDTPGYRAVGMDFEAEMREAMTGTADRPSGAAGASQAVDGLIARPDGNNVSMDREGLNLAEAQLRFKTGVALLRRRTSESWTRSMPTASSFGALRA